MTGNRPAQNDEGKTTMSIKQLSSVNIYTAKVCEIQAALANLTEWADSLPAPDENDTIHGLHYGHLGVIEHIHNLLGQASQATDKFND